MRTPVARLLFHFFVGTLLWGGLFGFAHDYLPGPSWLRGVVFRGSVAAVVLLGHRAADRLGLAVPQAWCFRAERVTLFHIAYGAILGGVYGKLIDTDEARDHLTPRASLRLELERRGGLSANCGR